MKEELFTAVELETLDKLVVDTEKWRDDKVAEQAKTPLTSKPVFTGLMVNEKIQLIDREIKYLVNKGKINAARKAEEAAKKAAEEAKKKMDEDGNATDDKASTASKGRIPDDVPLPNFGDFGDPSKMTPDQMKLLNELMEENLKVSGATTGLQNTLCSQEILAHALPDAAYG
jgi:hypothetical protein